MEQPLGSDTRSGWAGSVGLGLILLLTVVCYVRVTGFELVTWDDPQQLTENPLVLSTSGPSMLSACCCTLSTSPLSTFLHAASSKTEYSHCSWRHSSPSTP